MPTQRDSPVHKRIEVGEDLLRSVQVARVMRAPPAPAAVAVTTATATTPDGPPLVAATAATIRADHDLRAAGEALLAHKLREIAVTDENGQIVGLLDEADIAHWYLEATAKGTDDPAPPDGDLPNKPVGS